MDTNVDLTIYPVDGPSVRLWKTMHGEDWLTAAEILSLLNDSQYKETTLRGKLADTKAKWLERRRIKPFGFETYVTQYRIVDLKQPPLEPSCRNRKVVAERQSIAEEVAMASFDAISAMFGPRKTIEV